MRLVRLVDFLRMHMTNTVNKPLVYPKYEPKTWVNPRAGSEEFLKVKSVVADGEREYRPPIYACVSGVSGKKILEK